MRPTREELLDRIDARIRADVAGGLAGVARMALAARGDGLIVQQWSPRAVIEVALTAMQQRKSGWTRADLAAEINAALPDYLGLPDGADVTRLLDTLTDEAITCVRSLDQARPGDGLLPEELRLANGDSAYVGPARPCTRPPSTSTPSARSSRPPPSVVRRRCRTRSRPRSSTACAPAVSSWVSTRPPPCVAC